MQKRIIITLSAILFLLSNAMAAKLPSRGFYEHDENVSITYDTISSNSMYDLLIRENASPADLTQRTPFEEEIAMHLFESN